ncbi:hypothetical protein EZS27_030854 [termite gut metagenome]|uniref:ApeA N-terminal domain-containing protein n=1 Tax=termite gut metagenome TaxID=433724 RepID=A0A5J4QDN4_9ZZZZ
MFFYVFNSENRDYNIIFQYIPSFISNWDRDKYEIHLFENLYLNAENDVFEVYEHTIKDERLGWIFPITILESNENDYTDCKNLNHYKFIAYQKLLEQDAIVSVNDKSIDYGKLSDIFPNTIVCILCKETSQKIRDFRIDNYLLSFYDYGYLHFEGYPKAQAIYDRAGWVTEMRQHKRVILHKANFDITINGYTNALFKEHLLQSDNHIIRFIFLYQIIEHFIQVDFDSQFKTHLNSFNNRQLTLNDFKEEISTLSSERKRINNVFASVQLLADLKSDFVSEFDFLINDIGRTYKKNTFEDKIYDFRNLITHDLRQLTPKVDSLKKIIGIFERITVSLLIHLPTYLTLNKE